MLILFLGLFSLFLLTPSTSQSFLLISKFYIFENSNSIYFLLVSPKNIAFFVIDSYDGVMRFMLWAGGSYMLINNEFQYDDKHFIIINNIKDNIYYYIDYDNRSVSNNMEFQHLHPFYEILILLAPNASHLIEGTP